MKQITRVWEGNTNDLLRAHNAHDELVEALKGINSWLSDNFYDQPDAGPDKELWDGIEQALAKAEGKNEYPVH